MRAIIISTVLLICALLVSAGAPAATSAVSPGDEINNLAIIVNKSNPVEDLSSVELRKILLAERSHWPGGRKITLVMLQQGRDERAAVLRDGYHMSEREFGQHFLRSIFKGETSSAPKTISGPSGMRNFVFNVPGAIGYVRASEVDGSVKVVRVDGRLPGAPGYRLKVQR